MDAPDALLNRHWVPRQIEIDQRVAELQVASFAARFSANQKWNLIAESRDRRVLFRSRHSALEQLAGDAFARDQFGQPLQRLTVMNEAIFFSTGLRFSNSISAFSLLLAWIAA